MSSFWQHRVAVVALAAVGWMMIATPANAQLVTSIAEPPVDASLLNTGPIELENPNRFREFLDATVLSPLFYVQVAGAGLLDQLGGFPEEWKDAGGYGHRNVARLEQMLLGEAIGQGVAAALNHEVRYDPCACRGFLPRTGHALARVFVSRQVDGRRALNISRLVGAYGSAAIADFWYPASYTRQDIFVQATAGLALAGGVNILKEFIFK